MITLKFQRRTRRQPRILDGKSPTRRTTFMRTHRLPSGRYLAFKRLKSGNVFLMVNGEIRAQAMVHDGIKPWRVAQVFNSLARRFPERHLDPISISA